MKQQRAWMGIKSIVEAAAIEAFAGGIWEYM